MATAAAIEVIIRARDEASQTVTATLQKITGEAKQAETAIKGLGRGGAAAGALAELAGELAQGEASTGGMLQSAGQLATFFGGPWGAAIGLGAQALGMYMESSQKATAEQEKFNRAMLGFDAAPFVAEMQKATAAGDQFAAARAKEQAELRQQIAGETGLRRVLAEREGMAAKTATNMEEVEKHLRNQLQLNLDNLNAERRRAENEALQGKRAPLSQSDLDTFTQRAELLRDRFSQELGGRGARFAQEQARAEADATRTAERAAREQAQSQIDATREAMRAAEQAEQMRSRIGTQLAGAQRELTAAQQGADRLRWQETVGRLPAMQAHLAQVAPSLDPVRAAELAGELESLRRETADIERDDRRRAADERVQVAQQRVDKLAGDFATATTNADALTAKVKELGTALQQLEPGPGFAAKLSQALADTLEFLSARSP
jgi:hypothetical protein